MFQLGLNNVLMNGVAIKLFTYKNVCVVLFAVLK